jgi:GMP synthase (glutamine-hydrolysing)
MSPHETREGAGRAADERPDGIVILDFGGQYCHLIARRIREMKVYSEILPHDSSPAEILGLDGVMNVKGIILSGSPSSVGRKDAYALSEGVLVMGLPVLGLCYGHQLLAAMHGGDVHRGEVREYGVTYAIIDRPVGILRGMGPTERVWMSHGDTVFRLPSEFEVLAHTDSCPVAAFRHGSKPIVGLQWHPEVVHTERGTEMLRNFVFDVCRCTPNWRPEDTADRAVREIGETVDGLRAVIALSGGVDSSVAAALAARALGDRLVAVHVDHGFMRAGESNAVEETFRRLGVDLVVVRAETRFLGRLKGITDPEEKRRVIGEEFVRVFEAEARRAGAEYLIQGTIYPDRIESGFRRHSDKIKTHHNVGGLPLRMEFKGVVEPLRDLYKDEVRALGERLGLPDAIVRRQPFPGPGLAVRIVGEVTEEKLGIVRRADAIVCDEVESAGEDRNLWQYFAVLTDTKSTGVKGDERAYGWTVAVRLVESVDAMTASFRRVPWGLLERISTRITNEIAEVTRVVYDITHKPPSTIEWE